MTSVSDELQKSVFQALHGDAELVGILGGSKIYDQLPEKVDPPYVVLGTSRATDWSTSTEDGEVIEFSLHSWSDTSSRQQSHEIQDRIKTLLVDSQLALSQHALVNMRQLYCETARDRNSAYLHGVMRFRGVTEPLS